MTAVVVAAFAPAAGAQSAKPEVRSSTMPHVLVDRAHPQPYATDELRFELAPAESPGWRLEYKLGMKAGDALLYSLVASGPVVSEFHGELSNEATMFYREDAATRATHGQFIAPADGAHGWYIANTTREPVTVTLRFSGRYEKAPGLITFKN